MAAWKASNSALYMHRATTIRAICYLLCTAQTDADEWLN
jgi:hypothetical protein